MKRSNNVLRFLYLVVLIACIAVVINVFVVITFKVHPRSRVSLNSYIDNVSVVSEKIHAKRGNIYSSDGIIVAQDTETYDIICYLSPTRVKSNNEPAYVVDPAKTAQILANVLDGDFTSIFYNLTANPKLYQTEIGLIGRNISEEKKAEIETYDLPGISFRTSYARTYTQGSSFAPYLLGYAQSNEEGKLIGKMGLEVYFNSELSGVDGNKTYQQDKNGYVLKGMYEEETPPQNGYEVYTTIDSSIQDALEASFDDLAEGHGKAWGSVVEIDTGKILAWSQDPSYNPNTLNFEDTSWLNLGANYLYEPGSVFKSIIYAAAMEEGIYNGTQAFDSSAYCYSSNGNEPYRTYSGNGYGCIYNANSRNWGNIALDYGLIFSSNVATSTLMQMMGSNTFLKYVHKFGFFDYVDTDGIAEDVGLLNFTYPSEKLSLTYGQGSSVTMLQLLQAYTAIFGNGEMIKPYFIDKIVNPDTNQTIYEGRRTVVDRVISEDTAKQMQDLLYRVVYDDRGTAKIYKVNEVEIMAKTGTGEISTNGSYEKGVYTNSVMLAFPADKPKYMIYYAYEYPYDYGNEENTGAITSLIKKVALYENVNYDSSNLISTDIEEYKMPNLVSKTYSSAYEELSKLNVNIYKIGSGNNVINQYPLKDEAIYTNGKAFLLTDSGNTVVPDFTGWTRKEIINYWTLSGLAINIDGFGVIYDQSITPGTTIGKGEEITVHLKQIDSYFTGQSLQNEETKE